MFRNLLGVIGETFSSLVLPVKIKKDIDPITMNAEEREILGACLIESRVDLAKIKLIGNEQVIKSRSYEIRIMRPLLIKNDSKFSFDVLGDEIGRGSHSIILESKGSIHLIEKEGKLIAQFKERPPEKEKAIKRSYKNLENEYEKSKKITHLNVKKPVSIGGFSFLKMNKITGNNNYIEYFMKQQLEIRLQFCMALLNSYKNQVVEKNLFHGDLMNQNNILVQPETMNINFIDFEHSEHLNDTGPNPDRGGDMIGLSIVIKDILDKKEPFGELNQTDAVNYFLKLKDSLNEIFPFDDKTKELSIKFENVLSSQSTSSDFDSIRESFFDLLEAFCEMEFDKSLVLTKSRQV